MGPTHKTKYKPGDRINDKFTLIRNYCRPTTVKGKNLWLWECKCDCGNIFHCRENQLTNRYGCHSCTNKKTSTETALRKKNGVQHSGLKNRLYKDYKSGACKRGLDFELSFEDFVALMEQNCVYCGAKPELHDYELQYMQKTIAPWKHNGIDRVNTKEGYVEGNVVPCCSKCNYAKHDMEKEEFKEWLDRAYHHFVLEESVNENTQDEDLPEYQNTIDYPQFHVCRNRKDNEKQ